MSAAWKRKLQHNLVCCCSGPINPTPVLHNHQRIPPTDHISYVLLAGPRTFYRTRTLPHLPSIRSAVQDRGHCSVAERGRVVVVPVTVSGNYSGPVTWVDGGKKGGLKLLTRSCPWPGLTACWTRWPGLTLDEILICNIRVKE